MSLALSALSSHSVLSASPGGVPLSWVADAGAHLEVETLENGILEIRTTGPDPQIVFEIPPGSEVGADQTVLAFEYFCPDGVDTVEVFYKAGSSRNWSQNRSMEQGPMPFSEAWTPYSLNLQAGTGGDWTAKERMLRLDFGRKPGLHLQIRNMHLRAPNAQELQSVAEQESILREKEKKAARIRDYLHQMDHLAVVEKVTADADSIRIQGRWTDSTRPSQASLVAFQAHESPWETGHGKTVASVDTDSETFHFKLPRFNDSRDALENRYAIATQAEEGFRLLSHAVWVSDPSAAAERDMPRLRPANKKGLGGVLYKAAIFEEDLIDLGISAATVNISAGALLRPDQKTIPYAHQGRQWNFNAAAVRQLDRTIAPLTDLGCVVTGILLVDRDAGILVHPEYDPAGAYSMPNLDDPEAVATFRALVSFLAERYSRPDRAHGWISHWIAFNEIDYGWIWTNMGEQPFEIYMDLFEKGLRLIWLETRRFNPSSEVFVSLTHNWDRQPPNPLRAYAPRRQVDYLALTSRLLGDYHWGLAYHPYPQRLLEPRTWNDAAPTASFDTPYITPKNIEVLDAYLHQPHLLYDGSVRTVLLSEQGFHTPDYSDESMRVKAAAIAYTWAKIVPLKSIESFHYHRWVDHPLEGGLKVGLRTLPDEKHPHGIRKEPAFTVFSALETEAAEAGVAPLKEIVGIECWEDVRLRPDDIRH